MFDRIPFGGAGRIVTNRYNQTKAIHHLVLQVIFPGSRHRAVTAAAIRLDQQPSGIWKTLQAFRSTPSRDVLHRKSRSIRRATQIDRALIELQIVNTVRDCGTQRILFEVMHVDPFGGLTPYPSRVPEVADQLLFLRIDADARLASLLMLSALFLNMLKLLVALRVGSFSRLMKRLIR